MIRNVERYLLPFLYTSKTWISKAYPSTWLAVWNSRRLEGISQATTALSASAQPLHKQLGGEIMLTSLSNGAALMQMLSLVTSPSVSPVRDPRPACHKPELLNPLAYWNGQHSSAVSIAAEHRNGFCYWEWILHSAPTNNSLEDSDSYKHSEFCRLRLHSCAPILVLGAQYS